MYNSVMYITLWVSQTLHTNYEFPWHPLQQVCNSENTHCSTPYQGIILTLKSFSYTLCTDLYSSLTYNVYMNHEVPWRQLQTVYDSEKDHGLAPPQADHHDANHIFLHT